MTIAGAIENRFSLTERAARRVTELTSVSDNERYLRLTVIGGGCSGFQYEFKLETHENPDDIRITKLDATILIDNVSVELVNGSTLDFVDDLMGQSFRVQNPNAKSSCGCGVSFSL